MIIKRIIILLLKCAHLKWGISIIIVYYRVIGLPNKPWRKNFLDLSHVWRKMWSITVVTRWLFSRWVSLNIHLVTCIETICLLIITARCAISAWEIHAYFISKLLPTFFILIIREFFNNTNIRFIGAFEGSFTRRKSDYVIELYLRFIVAILICF